MYKYNEVYPNIIWRSNYHEIEREVQCILSTILRKKSNDGIWYISRLQRRLNVAKLDDDVVTRLISRFNYDIYMYMLFGKIDTLIVDIECGKPMWERDHYQMSEEIRLNPIKFTQSIPDPIVEPITKPDNTINREGFEKLEL